MGMVTEEDEDDEAMGMVMPTMNRIDPFLV
jgi:hypothetical protein